MTHPDKKEHTHKHLCSVHRRVVGVFWPDDSAVIAVASQWPLSVIRSEAVHPGSSESAVNKLRFGSGGGLVGLWAVQVHRPRLGKQAAGREGGQVEG